MTTERDILETIGITPEIGAMFERVDTSDIGAMDDEEELGRRIRRRIRKAAPVLTRAQITAITALIVRQMRLQAKVYSTAAGAIIAAQNLRPNAAVGLKISDAAYTPGKTYAGGTTFALVPHTNGVADTEAFQMTRHMVFYRLTSSNNDVASRWVIAANTAKFSDDVASGFPFDLPLDCLRAEMDFRDTPLGLLQGRAPQQTISFEISVRLDNTVVQPFYGLTLEYYDATCKSRQDLWQDSTQSLGFAGIVQRVRRLAMASGRAGGATSILRR